MPDDYDERGAIQRTGGVRAGDPPRSPRRWCSAPPRGASSTSGAPSTERSPGDHPDRDLVARFAQRQNEGYTAPLDTLRASKAGSSGHVNGERSRKGRRWPMAAMTSQTKATLARARVGRGRPTRSAETWPG